MCTHESTLALIRQDMCTDRVHRHSSCRACALKGHILTPETRHVHWSKQSLLKNMCTDGEHRHYSGRTCALTEYTGTHQTGHVHSWKDTGTHQTGHMHSWGDTGTYKIGHTLKWQSAMYVEITGYYSHDCELNICELKRMSIHIKTLL